MSVKNLKLRLTDSSPLVSGEIALPELHLFPPRVGGSLVLRWQHHRRSEYRWKCSGKKLVEGVVGGTRGEIEERDKRITNFSLLAFPRASFIEYS